MAVIRTNSDPAKINVCTLNGVRYMAKTGLMDSCEGCVANGYTRQHSRLCDQLPSCNADRRVDGRNVYWVEASR